MATTLLYKSNSMKLISINHEKEIGNEYHQQDGKKSARCEDNPCSAMGSWNVKQSKWGYVPLICGYRTYRSKPRFTVGVRGGVGGSRSYERLDPDLEVSRESLGKPHHRHFLCHDCFCFLG
jgi:hypothetical protein